MPIAFDPMLVELRARLGNRQDLEARMPRWINYSFFELLLNPRFMFFELDAIATFNTVTSQADYTIAANAANFWFILDIRDNTNDRKLRRTHWHYMDKVVPVTGQPVRYYRFAANVTLDPIPDAIYEIQLRYRLRPDELTGGSSFQDLGTEWEDVIITMAAVKAFTALRLTQEAAQQRGILEQLMATKQDVNQLEDLDAENAIEMSMYPRI